MGLLRDAVNLGYITLDQYNDLAEEWSNYGYDARHYGNVESFQKMMIDFLDLGFLDLAAACADDMYAAVDYYESVLDYSAYYDFGCSRWRDNTTGQFIRDPYSWVRD
jgi:hypothetical protein